MVSVYSDEEGKFSMTHFCAMKNHPKLKLIGETDGEIRLDYVETPSPDHIIHEWTCYEGGKPAHTTVIDLHKI